MYGLLLGRWPTGDTQTWQPGYSHDCTLLARLNLRQEGQASGPGVPTSITQHSLRHYPGASDLASLNLSFPSYEMGRIVGMVKYTGQLSPALGTVAVLGVSGDHGCLAHIHERDAEVQGLEDSQ